MHVTIWTVILTVLTTLWVMMPAINDNEALCHIALPYWMIAEHWNGRGAGWMIVPVILPFPVYGWIIACAWKENRLLGGVRLVTCVHVGVMLLAVLMRITK